MNKKIVDIVKKVSTMYFDYGIRGVTMDDVAHKLAISKKTLYEYFKDKEKLVEAVLEYGRTEWDEKLSAFDCSGCNAIDEMFHFYELQARMIKGNKPAFVYDLRKYYPEIYEKFQKIKTDQVFSNFVSNLEKGKEEGLYRADLNADIISKLNLMRFESILNKEYISIDEYDSKELFIEIFKYHLYGITTEKGRKIFEQKLNDTTNS